MAPTSAPFNVPALLPGQQLPLLEELPDDGNPIGLCQGKLLQKRTCEVENGSDLTLLFRA